MFYEIGNNVSVSVPSNKVLPRRASSKDLRGAVTRRQSSKDLRSHVIRKQSSRDNVGHKNVKKDHVINLINRQSSQDFRLDRYTIRRDSINGLRIVSKDVTDDDRDTLNRLSDIAISEDKQQFSKFQQDALKAHNNYRNRHGVANLTLDNQLCKRKWSRLKYVKIILFCNFKQFCVQHVEIFCINFVLDHPSQGCRVC